MLPVNTGLILRYLHPDLEPNVDFSVGIVDGVVYLRWHSAISRPTDQVIINAALSAVRFESMQTVKIAAAKKYSQYASSAPGKDAVYSAKQAEASAYTNGGANNGPVGPYIQARMTKTGETAAAVAAEWLAKSAAWNALAAQIDAIQDKATQDINAATTEGQCATIANAAIAEIEAL